MLRHFQWNFTPLLPVVFFGQVSGNGEEPGSEMSAVLVAWQGFIYCQEELRSQVFCTAHLSGPVVEVLVDRDCPAVIEGMEQGWILLCRQDQLGILIQKRIRLDGYCL